MERKNHPVVVDGVEACGESEGPANRAKRIVAISLHIYKVEEAGGIGGYFSRLDLLILINFK